MTPLRGAASTDWQLLRGKVSPFANNGESTIYPPSSTDSYGVCAEEVFVISCFDLNLIIIILVIG